MNDQHVALGGQLGNRREIAQDVVARFVEQRIEDRSAADCHQRMSIGCRRRQEIERDQTARAGPVVDHERLAERVRKSYRKAAHDDVRAAARGKPNKGANGPIRKRPGRTFRSRLRVRRIDSSDQQSTSQQPAC
jgi:hypothetical protein